MGSLWDMEDVERRDRIVETLHKAGYNVGPDTRVVIPYDNTNPYVDLTHWGNRIGWSTPSDAPHNPFRDYEGYDITNESFIRIPKLENKGGFGAESPPKRPIIGVPEQRESPELGNRPLRTKK